MSASSPRLCAGLWAALLAWAGCSLEPLDHSGKQCPCGPAYECIEGRCLPDGTAMDGGPAGDGTGTDAGPSDAGTPNDAATVDCHRCVDGRVVPCEAAEDRVGEHSACQGDMVTFCDRDGALVTTRCPDRCDALAGRCLDWTPSDLPSEVLDEADRELVLDATAPHVVFETDTGRITTHASPGEPVMEVLRGPGEGVTNGIGFRVRVGSGAAPDTGVFTFRALEVPADVTVRGAGVGALAIVGATLLRVNGTIDVGAAAEPGAAGSGGWPGGESMTDGAGPGGGRPGINLDDSMGLSSVHAPGGAGGTFGYLGGHGGETTSDSGPMRGIARDPYGAAALVPLMGGSGGGGGGQPGGTGGGGGGAVQLVAGAALLLHGIVDASGGPGGGGQALSGGCGGGAGAGAGGGILLEAPAVLTAGASIGANGGSGGQGCQVLLDPDVAGEDGMRARPQGGWTAAPDTSNGGGAGGTGSSPDGLGTSGRPAERGGGGGGGGGRIRVNSVAMVDDLTVFSPIPSSRHGLFTTGSLTPE